MTNKFHFQKKNWTFHFKQFYTVTTVLIEIYKRFFFQFGVRDDRVSASADLKTC